MTKGGYKKHFLMEVKVKLISIGPYIQSASEKNGGRNWLGGGGVIHHLSPNNDLDQHSARILHISSIATNNDQCNGQCFKKLVRLSGWKTFPDTLNILSTGTGKA